MDLGRPPMARFPTVGDEVLTQWAITHKDLDFATKKVSMSTSHEPRTSHLLNSKPRSSCPKGIK